MGKPVVDTQGRRLQVLSPDVGVRLLELPLCGNRRLSMFPLMSDLNVAGEKCSTNTRQRQCFVCNYSMDCVG